MAESKPYALEPRRVRASFAGAAGDYDAAAVLQHEVGARLDARLDFIRLTPMGVVDVGCGTGRQTRLLGERYPDAALYGIDFATAMLDVARTGTGTKRPPTWLCADAAHLPLADASIDLVFSNLMLQWCLDLETTFTELRRVLRPGGLLLFSTFGPDTLGELRASWAEVDDRNHVNAFFDMHDIGDALLRGRFADPVMDCEHITLTYPDVVGLMRDLKTIGARNLTAGRPRGLTGRRALATLADAYATFRRADGTLPATYEVVYGHAWRAPDDGAAASVPVAALQRGR